MPDATDAIDALETHAERGIAKSASDGLSVEALSVADRIEAIKFLQSQEAAAKRGRGLRFTRLLPPGAA